MPEPPTAWSDGLLESGFGSPRIADLLSWPARIRAMLDVERALARAQARAGVIPVAAAAAIAVACDPDRIDVDALARDARAAATPVIPLVRAIAEGADPLAAAYLHHGATSQDIIDTATVRCVREALVVLTGELARAGDRCAQLAEAHRGTIMAGRTLGQHAVPITFGLRAARWLGMLDRRIEQLRVVAPRVAVVQLGGAAGTSSVLGDRALEVGEDLASELGLALPDLPWHAERDRVTELAGALAGVAAAAADVATDLVLLAQTEVGEVAEVGDGQAGSSAMPHKRNPVHAVAARAAARLAMGEIDVLLHAGEHEHERAAGAWQAEWVALPGALVRTGGALERLSAALHGLHVDADRAGRNLAAGLGLTASEAIAAALAPHLGRIEAQRLVGELAAAAVARTRDLVDVAAEDERVARVLSHDDLAAATDPAVTVRSAGPLIDRALARHRDLTEPAPPA